MSDKTKATLYNFVFGNLNNFITIFFGIILVPYYLKFFNVELYGVWIASAGVIALLGTLESGLSFIFTQKLADCYGKENTEGFLKITYSAFVVIIIILSLFTSLLYISIPYIPGFVNCPDDSVNILISALKIAIVSGVFTILNSNIGCFTAVWQITFIPQLIRILATLFSVIILVVCLNNSLSIISLSVAAASRELFVFLFLSLFTLKKWINIIRLKPIFSYNSTLKLFNEIAFPFFGRLAKTTLNSSHKFLIAGLISPTFSALYDFTSKTIIMSSFIVKLFTNGSFASLSLSRSEKDDKNYMNDVYKVFSSFMFLLLIFLGFGLIFSENVVEIWVGIDKFLGFKIVFIIALAYFLSSIFNFVDNLILVEGKFNMSTWYNLLNTAIYLSFTLILIIYIDYGIYSIPLALIISSIFVISFYIYNSEILSRLIKIYSVKILKLTTLMIGLIFLNLYMQNFVPSNGIIYFISSVILYFTIVFFTVYVTVKDISRIINNVLKRIKI